MRAPIPRHLDEPGVRDVLSAVSDLGDRVDKQFERVDRRFEQVDERLRKMEVDIAETKGRMTGIEGQLRQIPTLWQIAALVFAIFGAAFVLLHFGMPTHP
ncbi:MAG: hypothetical protein HQL37_09420 [Alphaproteobacteria bacterium]|nr:hypothetical protein [Alphaproteobacteria bacterium]